MSGGYNTAVLVFAAFITGFGFCGLLHDYWRWRAKRKAKGPA